MLILTPSKPVYFCTRDGDDAIPQTYIEVAPCDDGCVMVIHEGSSVRTVAVPDRLSCRVSVHDYDQNHTAYVTWFSDSGEIGIDCDKAKVLVLRHPHIVKSNGSPKWGRV